MSGPLIFISHSRVKPGKGAQYQAHLAEATEMVETEEPQMIAFNSYESRDGAEVSTIQVHPDADSLDRHLKLFSERLSARVFDAVETDEVTVYGVPSDGARELLEQMAAQTGGLRVRILPVHSGGFLRPQPL